MSAVSITAMLEANATRVIATLDTGQANEFRQSIKRFVDFVTLIRGAKTFDGAIDTQRKRIGTHPRFKEMAGHVFTN